MWGAFWGLMVGLIVGLIRFGLEFGYSIPACGTGISYIYLNQNLNILQLVSIYLNRSTQS